MKYKSISLNGTDNYQYSLVKYEDKYKYILDSIEGIDTNLIDSVMACPVIYSINSDHQAYMIVKGDDIGVGATYIGTSTDEKDLEVKLQLDESKFANETEMYMLINQLVDSLGLYCYERKNICIELLNKIDLSKYNCLKYNREYLLPNIFTYVCSNNKYNKTIPLLLKEIKSCEDTLVSWKQTWWQEIQHRTSDDFHLLFDNDYIEKSDEMFSKASSFSLVDYTQDRNVTFDIDGNVSFSKKIKKNDSMCEFTYNVRKDGFNVNTFGFLLEDDQTRTKIITPNEELIKSKEKGTKKIIYKSDIVDKSSIYLEVRLDDNDDIDKCYIDFRTHRNNGKINGMYLIRINNRDKNFSFSYRSRKGDIYKYIDNIYYDDERLSMDTLKNRIEFFIDVINKCYRNGRGAISSDIDIRDLVNTRKIEKDVINFMKQIKSEIPLPYLQEQIDKFILEYSKSKNGDKVKKLQ